MMLGYLFARAGVEVIVLEKHKDFLRDFRGDTIHPSTLDLMYELNLLDDFLKLPHQKIFELAAQIGDDSIPLADFSYLPTHCKFIAFMPQWDFLNFLAERAERYPTFHLKMETEVTDLIGDEKKITGVRTTGPDGSGTIAADLVVGADGRHSVVRQRAELAVKELGAPIDVLWFRIKRTDSDPGQVLGRFIRGKIMVMLNRGDYWQCGYVIPKGGFEELKTKGIDAFRRDVVTLAPFVQDRIAELNDWNEIRLLTVAVDRLLRWHKPGLLCIGDAAHAMSPVGGVGINLAIQDAVAAANILVGPCRNGKVSDDDLHTVQQRRTFPTQITQAVQVFVQNRVIGKVLGETKARSAPLFLKVFRYLPFLRWIPARIVGLGVRAEHIRTPDVFDNN